MHSVDSLCLFICHPFAHSFNYPLAHALLWSSDPSALLHMSIRSPKFICYSVHRGTCSVLHTCCHWSSSRSFLLYTLTHWIIHACMYSFIHSFIYSFFLSVFLFFMHSSNHSFNQPFIQPTNQPSIHSVVHSTHPLMHTRIQSFVLLASCTQSFLSSCISLFTQSYVSCCIVLLQCLVAHSSMQSCLCSSSFSPIEHVGAPRRR